jgi:hypothetical protein
MNEETEIALLAVCDCGKPNILWQPWRHLFRCGYCGHDYTHEQAQNLKLMSEDEYKEVARIRRNAVVLSRKVENILKAS